MDPITHTHDKIADRGGGLHVRVITRCTYYDTNFQLYVVPRAVIATVDRDLLALKPQGWDSSCVFKLLFPQLFDIFWESEQSEYFCGDFTKHPKLHGQQEKAFGDLDLVYVDVLWFDNLEARRRSSKEFYEALANSSPSDDNALDAAKFSGLVLAASDTSRGDNAAATKLVYNCLRLTPADIEPYEPTTTLWGHPSYVPFATGAVATWRAPADWSFEMMAFLPIDPAEKATAKIVLQHRTRALANVGAIIGGIDRICALYRLLYGVVAKHVDCAVQPLFDATAAWLTTDPGTRERAIQAIYGVFAWETDSQSSMYKMTEAAIMSVGVLGLPPVSVVGSTLAGDAVTLLTNVVQCFAADSSPEFDLANVAAKACFCEQTDVVVMWNDVDVSHVHVSTMLRMALEALQTRSTSIECCVFVRSGDLEVDLVGPANNRRYFRRLLQRSIGASPCRWRCLCIALRRTLHPDCIDDHFFATKAGTWLH